MTRICTICARSGSKGVPGKNVLPVLGMPLIGYTIRTAKQSGLFDAIAVSSDASTILQAAKDFGADIMVERPTEFATDNSSKIPAILHCLTKAEQAYGSKCKTFADLDVTSPLRLPDDIRGAVELLETSNASSVITGCHSRRSPYFNMVELNPDGVPFVVKPMDKPLVRRQDAPVCYDMNASIYVWDRDAFINNPRVFFDNTKLFVMPVERSIDIDHATDVILVEALLAARSKAEVNL